MPGGSRTFAGGTDKIVVPSGMVGLLTGHIVSVACWFYPTSSVTGYEALCDTSGRQLSMLLGGAANHLFIGVGGQQNEINLTGSWTLNAWNHLVLTYNGVNANVYQNGSNAFTTAGFVSPTFSAEAWSIGANPSGGGAAFVGSIGEMCVWKSELTSGNVTTLYGGGTAGALPRTVDPTNIVGYFPLRGVSGPEPDCSTTNGINGGTANGNDGVVTGTSQGAAPPVAYQTSPFVSSASGITFFLPQTTSVNFSQSLAGSTFNGGTANPTTGLTIDQAYQINENLTSAVTLSWPVGPSGTVSHLLAMMGAGR